MPSRSLVRRWMGLSNVVLACGAVGLIVLLSGSIMEHLSVGATMVVPDDDRTRRQSSSLVEGTPSGGRSPMPALGEYQIVVERDPFKHPQESMAPVVLKPASVPVVPMVPKALVPRPPLPPLSVTLSGTVVIGDQRMAILKDARQEDLYVIGQDVGGGVLEKIEGDRVVIARAGERTELLMKSAVEGAGAQLVDIGKTGFGKESEGKGGLTDKLLAQSEEKKKKIVPSNKLLFTTPAFARYPGATYGGGKP